jgi:hypothetical protein
MMPKIVATELKDTSNNGRFCRVGAQRRVLFAI